MNFWMHSWRLNRQAHSRTIQIIDVKHNIGQVIADMQKKINKMSNKKQAELVDKIRYG